jgi:hypothetical protein
MAAPSSEAPFFIYALAERFVEVHLHEPRSPARVPERLVHDIWAQQQFDRSDLAVVDGRPLRVFHPGRPNAHGGPDFRDALLELDGTPCLGDVEIHVYSSDWEAHRHVLDVGYNRTVLHVVLYADAFTGAVRRQDGVLVPELVLHTRLKRPLRGLLYDFHRRVAGALPCRGLWAEVDPASAAEWMARLGRQRLSARPAAASATYRSLPEREDLLHRAIFRALGAEPNGDALEQLAVHLPLETVRTMTDPADIEALHLGVAGLLPPDVKSLAHTDPRSAGALADMARRFGHWRGRLGIPTMPPEQWQFFRLRPANFPTLRIAQAAALVAPGRLLRHDPLGALATAAASPRPLAAVADCFEATPSLFWSEHYRFEARSRRDHPAGIGRTRIERIVVNAVAPALLFAAELESDPVLEAAAVRLARLCRPEQDAVTERFAGLAPEPRNALATQGLHALYRDYCLQARCLECPIGRQALSGG